MNTNQSGTSMFNSSYGTRETRMRMLAMSAMIAGGMMLPPEQSDPSHYRSPGKSISKAERAKRNVRKNIAKQSKKRNRKR